MEGQSHQGSWDFGRFFDDCLFDDYGSGVSFEVTYRLYQHFGLSLDAAQVIHSAGREWLGMWRFGRDRGTDHLYLKKRLSDRR